MREWANFPCHVLRYEKCFKGLIPEIKLKDGKYIEVNETKYSRVDLVNFVEDIL